MKTWEGLHENTNNIYQTNVLINYFIIIVVIGKQYQIRFTPGENAFAVNDKNTDLIHVMEDNGQQDFFLQTSFILREGLCGDNDYISIESKLYPGKFWRHSGYIILLHDEDSSDIFKQDSCFKIMKHRCNNNDESQSVTFESRNYPGHFITKCGDQMRISTDADNCGSVDNKCWALDESHTGNYDSNI